MKKIMCLFIFTLLTIFFQQDVTAQNKRSETTIVRQRVPGKQRQVQRMPAPRQETKKQRKRRLRRERKERKRLQRMQKRARRHGNVGQNAPVYEPRMLNQNRMRTVVNDGK